MFRRQVNKLKWVFIPIVSIILLFLPYILGLIGLSSVGPIAGGFFSTMQGAGIVSGSFMAMIQSFAMSGWVILIQLVTAVSWIIISLFAFIKKYLFYYKIKTQHHFY
jgi:hypothetical protein